MHSPLTLDQLELPCEALIDGRLGKADKRLALAAMDREKLLAGINKALQDAGIVNAKEEPIAPDAFDMAMQALEEASPAEADKIREAKAILEATQRLQDLLQNSSLRPILRAKLGIEARGRLRRTRLGRFLIPHNTIGQVSLDLQTLENSSRRILENLVRDAKPGRPVDRQVQFALTELAPIFQEFSNNPSHIGSANAKSRFIKFCHAVLSQVFTEKHRTTYDALAGQWMRSPGRSDYT